MPQTGGTWSAQVEPELNQQLEKYHENHGVSKSETVRYLLREGLDRERTEKTETPGASKLVLVLLSALLGAVLGFGMLTHGLFGVAVLLAAAAIGGVIGKIAIDRRGGEDG